MASFLSNLLAKSPISPMSSKVELALSEEEMAGSTDKLAALSERCEFRIEGMTCGACVEVSLEHRIRCGRSLHLPCAIVLVDRKYAQVAAWDTLRQGGLVGGEGRR